MIFLKTLLHGRRKQQLPQITDQISLMDKQLVHYKAVHSHHHDTKTVHPHRQGTKIRGILHDSQTGLRQESPKIERTSTHL